MKALSSEDVPAREYDKKNTSGPRELFKYVGVMMLRRTCGPFSFWNDRRGRDVFCSLQIRGPWHIFTLTLTITCLFAIILILLIRLIFVQTNNNLFVL